jgi:GTP1/Obg family GTP-binding protein
MKETAVEWLSEHLCNEMNFDYWKAVEQAKEMEKKEKLKHQLFIGKVSDIIGFDKTLELLRECNNTIK